MSSNLAPLLFVGHGSPMNALANNAYTKKLNTLKNLMPKPKAILCVSAHWMTEGTWVTHMKQPKTIHDFYGFPEELMKVQYPAPGSPEIAEEIVKSIGSGKIHLDDEQWGLDHGTWSVLKHIYSDADVPVLQLSLHMEKPPEYHFKLGVELGRLREQGIFIIGSGNIVHNLSQIKWQPDAKAFSWALEFDRWSKEQIENRNFKALTNDFQITQAGKLSVPTLEHYLPMLYILGASTDSDKLTFEYEEMQNASISMRTFSYS